MSVVAVIVVVVYLGVRILKTVLLVAALASVYVVGLVLGLAGRLVRPMAAML
jgi:hypothetical protein